MSRFHQLSVGKTCRPVKGSVRISVSTGEGVGVGVGVGVGAGVGSVVVPPDDEDVEDDDFLLQPPTRTHASKHAIPVIPMLTRLIALLPI